LEAAKEPWRAFADEMAKGREKRVLTRGTVKSHFGKGTIVSRRGAGGSPPKGATVKIRERTSMEEDQLNLTPEEKRCSLGKVRNGGSDARIRASRNNYADTRTGKKIPR